MAFGVRKIRINIRAKEKLRTVHDILQPFDSQISVRHRVRLVEIARPGG